MGEDRKQWIREAVADTFAEEYVREVLEALEDAEARAEEAEAAAYPAQLAEIRAAVEVYCDPPPNGGHVQAIRRLAAERDRMREERDSLQRWREGILGCELTHVILRAAEKLGRSKFMEVGGD